MNKLFLCMSKGRTNEVAVALHRTAFPVHTQPWLITTPVSQTPHESGQEAKRSAWPPSDCPEALQSYSCGRRQNKYTDMTVYYEVALRWWR